MKKTIKETILLVRGSNKKTLEYLEFDPTVHKETLETLYGKGYVLFDDFVKQENEKPIAAKSNLEPAKKIILGLENDGLSGVDLSSLIQDSSLSEAEYLKLRLNFLHDNLDEILIKLFKNNSFPKLTTLHLEEASEANTPEYNPGKITSASNGWWKALPNLNHLVLELINIETSEKYSFKKLKSLTWWPVLPQQRSISSLLSTPHPHLRSLSLDFCTSLIFSEDSWLDDFKELFTLNLVPKLEELHLTSMNINSVFLKYLLDSKLASNLRILDISGNECDSQTIDLLTHKCSLLPKIEKIILTELINIDYKHLVDTYSSEVIEFRAEGSWSPFLIDS
ncbi:MAG: hypothetical protein JNL74_06550 [Fibrobacteres bacterium]|nr:hypothetical protein [Fibrobacterota bacterium]